jgi:hypothetical protein
MERWARLRSHSHADDERGCGATEVEARTDLRESSRYATGYSGSEVIGHTAMQQRTSVSDVIVSDTAD